MGYHCKKLSAGRNYGHCNFYCKKHERRPTSISIFDYLYIGRFNDTCQAIFSTKPFSHSRVLYRALYVHSFGNGVGGFAGFSVRDKLFIISLKTTRTTIVLCQLTDLVREASWTT